jgi:hypothetical protein
MVTGMAAITAGASRATDRGLSGPVPARTTGPAAADRSPAAVRPGRTARSWPLLVLAAPAAAEVWSGWVGIARKTGFGLVSPLPGIWPSLHLDTTITLPVGVEAYAAYALRAWLATGHAVSVRTRRFAKWSAIFSFALGMAGQVAYHLLAQAGVTKAPWPVTTIVSCLPVLVLAMGTALAHMLRADAAAGALHTGTGEPAMPRSQGDQDGGDQDGGDRAGGDQAGGDHAVPWQDQDGGHGAATGPNPSSQIRLRPSRDRDAHRGNVTAPAPPTASPMIGQARLIARRLAEAGKPVSRRALRNGGVKGSNEALNALARALNMELAGRRRHQAGSGHATGGDCLAGDPHPSPAPGGSAVPPSSPRGVKHP